MIKKIAKKIGKKASSKKSSARKTTKARKPARKTTKVTKPARTKRPRTSKKISQEQLQDMISMKAYEIFEQKGSVHGDDMSDWFEAEKLVSTQTKLK
ncbi:MAG: DUF2934 domain-containing protein [Candidatus Omnitrophica bacterium]|nr:DUF2934 domain-containing protein [Candidatus Omnitrophota bacterium]